MYFEIEEHQPPYDFKRSLEIQSRRNKGLHTLIDEGLSDLKKDYAQHDMKINQNRKA